MWTGLSKLEILFDEIKIQIIYKINHLQLLLTFISFLVHGTVFYYLFFLHSHKYKIVFKFIWTYVDIYKSINSFTIVSSFYSQLWNCIQVK